MNSIVKIVVSVTKDRAIKAGSADWGYRPVEIDLARLSPEELNVVADFNDKNGVLHPQGMCKHYSEATPENAVDMVRQMVANAAEKAKAESKKIDKIAQEIREGMESGTYVHVYEMHCTAKDKVIEVYPDLAAQYYAYVDKMQDAANLEIAKRHQEQNDRLLVEREKEAAKKTKKEAEKTNWIATNGSEHLRRLTAEKIKCQGIYADERLVADRPGWVYSASSDVLNDARESDPYNPPPSAVELLDKARETDETAELIFLEYEPDCHGDYDDDDDDTCLKFYAAKSFFLGRLIYFVENIDEI